MNDYGYNEQLDRRFDDAKQTFDDRFQVAPKPERTQAERLGEAMAILIALGITLFAGVAIAWIIAFLVVSFPGQ